MYHLKEDRKDIYPMPACFFCITTNDALTIATIYYHIGKRLLHCKFELLTVHTMQM